MQQKHIVCSERQCISARLLASFQVAGKAPLGARDLAEHALQTATAELTFLGLQTVREQQLM